MKDGERIQQAAQEDTGYARELYPRREPVLVWIVLLIALCAPAALFASSKIPEMDTVSEMIYHYMGVSLDTGSPVGGLMDIEEAWAIEDHRVESDEPLVTRMYMNDAILGYDRESRTFYCTLGMNNGEQWPETSFTALGSAGVNCAWIDDFTYDYCSDAIEEGYCYELLAWTDTQYEYVGVVFTGLPIVTLHTDENAPIVNSEDVGTEVHISSGEYGGLYSRALVHKRGAGAFVGVPKHSYRLEFRTLDARGKEKRIERSVLGMEADSDFLLISNASDLTAIRNHLCWQLWKDWKDGRQLGELESRLVEVFLGDEYVGIYQLMEYVDPVRELNAVGGNPETDALVRMMTTGNEGYRPQRDRVPEDSFKIELRHGPVYMSPEEALDIYLPFDDVDVLRTYEMSDEEFTAIIEKHFDVQSLLDYFLFVQVYNLRDNSRNNVHVWAIRQDDGIYRFEFSPWDMDRSLCKCEEEGPIHETQIISRDMRMIERILKLDVGGSQRLLYDMYVNKRATSLSDDAIYQFVVEAEEMINASGAYLRESEKWRGGAQKMDLTWMSAEVISMQKTVEMYMKEMWCKDIAINIE